MNQDDYTIIARIGRPRGLYGEMQLLLETDFPQRLPSLKTLILISENQPEQRVLTVKIYPFEHAWFMRCKGINDRDQAKSLQGAYLAVPKAEAAELPAEFYYWSDLQGCELRHPDGRSFGTVADVARLPSCDMLMTVIDGEEVMLPFIDDVVKTVDLSNKIIIITPLPGMLPGENDED